MRRGAALPTAIAALGLLAPAMSAGHAEEPQAGGNVSNPVMSKRTAERALDFWTPQRMAEAEPLDMAPSTEPRARAPRTRTGGNAGLPDSVEPADPSDGVQRLVARAPRKPWKSFASGRPYTDTRLERVTVKIFFRQNGGSFVCSGTVVNSTSKDMVSTAGHCLSDGNGGWSDNVLVVPAYKSNKRTQKAPYGKWTAWETTIREEWLLWADSTQDFGYIRVNLDGKGRTIVDRVGGVGTRFHVNREKRVRTMGYPAAYPFDGNNQRVCGPHALAVASDDGVTGSGPAPMGAYCDMTQGASGGGWVTKIRKKPFQISLNSYKYVGGPRASKRIMYGPYFGDEAQSLFFFTADL
jgi:hypothetical protein